MALVQPFDLQTIFIDNFAGSLVVFVFIALIFVIILAARFRMTMLLTSMFVLMLLSVLYSQTILVGSVLPIYLLAVGIGGIIIALVVSRVIKQ